VKLLRAGLRDFGMSAGARTLQDADRRREPVWSKRMARAPFGAPFEIGAAPVDQGMKL
jgi:hypothetical protein